MTLIIWEVRQLKLNRLGYIAVINTADLDEISIGEIKFVKCNKNSNIIQLKLLVEYGLCDIVVGTVELTEDKQ